MAWPLTLAPLFVLLLAISPAIANGNPTVSLHLFMQLEELSRLVAISYCVGNQGIKAPFRCGRWCEGFPDFELVETWDLGLLDSASCGYVALSPGSSRIVVAFRGSNSLSDAVYDLMTQPAEYVPFPLDTIEGDTCEHCAVHSGFMYLWNSTREYLVPVVQGLVAKYPDYELVLAGHSLGGAIAGLAALEFAAKGWRPRITTFGEPRFGNEELAAYVDRVLVGDNTQGDDMRYRRVTHLGDPVPLLPFHDWGWRMHSGEIFIDQDYLPAELENVRHCQRSNDSACIQGPSRTEFSDMQAHFSRLDGIATQGVPGLPAEWRLWEILFAHRQYFWRIGLCWDPQNYEYPKDHEQLSDEL